MSRLALAIVAIALSLPALALDHSHKAWQALLAKQALPEHRVDPRLRHALRQSVEGPLLQALRRAGAPRPAAIAFLDYDWGLNDAR
jgi:hypothetical protein